MQKLDVRMKKRTSRAVSCFSGCYALGGAEGRDENRRQFISFPQKIVQVFVVYDSTFEQQLEPENSFIGFFQNDADLGDEFGLRPCPARGPVVCPNRGA